MTDDENLFLPPPVRSAIWRQTCDAIETYIDLVPDLPVSSDGGTGHLQDLLAAFDFHAPVAPSRALELAVSGLTQFQTHAPHPRYFGLFVPAPATMGIAADALTAAFNPQLAAREHSPFATAAEAHLLRAFGRRLGFCEDATGTFTSGGAEANLTALLCAIYSGRPEVRITGISTVGPMTIYVSEGAHDSIVRAARIAGLGDGAVRRVRCDARLRMNIHHLEDEIARDRGIGAIPTMIVGTAGTTTAGAIDDLGQIGEIAARQSVWFHVDGAWGLAAAIDPEARPLFAGLAGADSLSLDPHKWLATPMGAGMFMTRHHAALGDAFSIETPYMPQSAQPQAIEPYQSSLQWSRRFSGLRLLLCLGVAGWQGYAAAIRRQIDMGRYLRSRLSEQDWHLLNDSPLPIACFSDRPTLDAGDAKRLRTIAAAVVDGGEAWLNVVELANGRSALRACITNMLTSRRDIDRLIEALDKARHSTRVG
jgi:glutamate/tyrosine decarboxylase-like PLP-dependent enzyme